LKTITAIILSLLLSSTLFAEIEKIAIPIEKSSKLSYFWWPKLIKIDGWYQDKQSSYYYNMNTQVKDGKRFENAETIIYARAIYKPRRAKTKSLQEFIANDISSFETNASKALVKEVDSITTADNKSLVSYTFTPSIESKAINFEQVAYLDEGDFYIVFTISSRSANGLKSNIDIFKKFINNYKEKY
jgi:hypothetical protein